MIIWKNICGESWQDTIENDWEASGKPGAFLFFIPKGRTYSPPAKAGGGSPSVGRARALSEGDCSSCGSRWTRLHFCSAKLSALSTQSAQGFPFWKPLFMAWYIATPSRRLPASSCHRQLDTDTWVERFVPPMLVVRRISRRTCCNQVRKKGCCVSQ